MNKLVTFNKVGYEPFFDFLKTFAILCVLLGHTFPYREETGYSLWYGMQVPIFMLIQVFHALKKDDNKLNLKKIFQRIFIPFFAVQFLTYLLLYIKGGGAKSLISNVLIGGVRARILFSVGLFPNGSYPILD